MYDGYDVGPKGGVNTEENAPTKWNPTQDGDAAKMEIDPRPKVPANPAREEGEIEVGEVRQTLDEILIEADPSSSKVGPSKTAIWIFPF